MVSMEVTFPFLFGRAFIEAGIIAIIVSVIQIVSLPFRKGFH